ncbi:hypothetical protein AVP43_03172 [Geobacillus stearothermophilus]|nr:hypothetical protein AVP43_03172 [Geobacillus stearothermophilus]
MKESFIVNFYHKIQEEVQESVISFSEYTADIPEKVLQHIA